MKQLNKELLKSNIEKIAEYDFSNNKIFGSAYCVYQEDKVIYKNCFGTTSLNTQKTMGIFPLVHTARISGLTQKTKSPPYL